MLPTSPSLDLGAIKSNQSGKLDREYDCSNCRLGKYTIASGELLIVRPMGVHCEAEKKVGEPN
jgi:hypothetical protein